MVNPPLLLDSWQPKVQKLMDVFIELLVNHQIPLENIQELQELFYKEQIFLKLEQQTRDTMK